MKKIKIITPENIEVEYTLADIASRTAATLLDMLIQGIILLLLGLAVFLISHFSPSFWEEYYGWIIGISILVYAVICFGYYIFAELNMNGRTPGKKVLKLRAIRNNGQPLTFKHSAIRNLFKILIDSFGIGIVFIFFTKEHKRLGDMAASTVIIVEVNKTQPVTLENLQKINEHFNYIFTEEERELLREYLERRNQLIDCSQIRDVLTRHLTLKFESMGILNEWENFIKQL